MNDIALLFGIFGAVALVHCAAHRLWSMFGKPPITLLLLYAIGGVVAVFSVPVSLMVAYTLLSIISSILYVGVLVEGETPTDVLLSSFARNNKQTVGSLIKQFTEDGLLWRRLRDLTAIGLVRKNGATYVVTPAGMWIARWITWYTRVFARSLGG